MKSDPTIREVSVIFKTHLDIGFTDYAKNIVASYFEDFIPGALRLARETREQPERFVWTTGSWLIYKYLEQASRQNRRRMEEAILQGDFHWHALPFTTHTELMDENLFALGLEFRNRLDARFGRTTRAAKMTDVPGHSRNIVPLLAQAGVRLLHIGVNPASTVPAVPPVFVWKVEGSELVVLYDKVYGSTTALPGGRALSVNLTNDNLGPPSRREISDIYSALRRRYPQAQLLPGNLTAAADHLWKSRKELPVLRSEIGDTWIHGLGTDPQKVARFRSLSRLRQKWLRKGKFPEGGKLDLKFGEFLLLTAEHTWGMDVKTHLKDRRTYQRKSLSHALHRKNFRKLAASWQEQRAYIDQALAALPARLKREAVSELQSLKPARTRTTQWKNIPADEIIALGPWKLQLDPTRGFLQFLSRNETVLLSRNAEHRIAAPAYQTFSAADYRRFYRQYNTQDVEWARQDFTKTGLPESAASAWHVPRLKQILRDPSNCAFVANLVFDRLPQALGAPGEIQVRYGMGEEGIDIELQWFRKKAHRMPEALWLGFNPALARKATWTVQKLGRTLAMRDVVRDGARGLHASTGPVATAGFSINSLDAVLVAPGETKLVNFDNRLPRKGSGIQFNLWNNIWNTNFPLWSSDDARFRFELRWDRTIKA